MDKTRDVRRGASRFSRSRQIKQSIRPNNKKLFSGLDGVGGDFVSLEKSKKERVRKLSAVGRASSSCEEMGCEVSDREDNFRSQSPSTSICISKRFKVPMKFFDDCNGVDHASVPRKLRSAMKKRSRESTSPHLSDSKKQNHTNGGVEPKKDDSKKSKLNMKQGKSERSQRHSVSGPITKDEEEVVETLYALAGMFPDNDATDKSRLEGESLEAIPSALPEARESPMPAFEGFAESKEELNSVCPSKTADRVELSSKAEELLEDTEKLNSLNNPSVQGLCVLPNSKQFCSETYSPVPQVNLQTTPFSSKDEPRNEKTLGNSLHFGFAPELSLLDRGFKQPREQETSLSERKPELALGPATSNSGQLEQHSIRECKKNGLALWPGLSSTASQDAGNPGPILQSSTSKIPAWMDSAPSTSRPSSFEAGFSNDKVSERSARNKSWKRCAAHVYITRLIQAIQRPDRADRPPLQSNYLKPNEGTKQVNGLMVANSFSGVRNGLNGVVSAATRIDNCSPEKNLNEVRSVLQHKKLYQDQQHAVNASRASSLHKQSLDFFSLSSGGGGLEANNGINRSRKGLEPLSQFQAPYLNPYVQQHTQLSLPMSQTRYSSSMHPDQLSAAAQQVQLQLPHYLAHQQQLQKSNHLQQQQQQQQQWFWAPQLGDQSRTTTTSMATTLLQNWQNGRQNPTIAIQCAQAAVPTSTSPLEVVGPKYIAVSQHQQQQQQQQLMGISSSGRIKRQEHHISSAYEETGGGLRAGGGTLPLQLQLLCNERL